MLIDTPQRLPKLTINYPSESAIMTDLMDTSPRKYSKNAINSRRYDLFIELYGNNVTNMATDVIADLDMEYLK
jgi:hypothetical protein